MKARYQSRQSSTLVSFPSTTFSKHKSFPKLHKSNNSTKNKNPAKLHSSANMMNGSKKRSVDTMSEGGEYDSPAHKFAKSKNRSPHSSPPRFKGKKPTFSSKQQPLKDGKLKVKFVSGEAVALKRPLRGPDATECPPSPPVAAPVVARKAFQKIITARAELAAQIENVLPNDFSMKQPGFKNFTGALCYRHSLLQALLHTPKFVNWLFASHKFEDCCADNQLMCIACTFRDLATVYWKGQRDPHGRGISTILHDLNKLLSKRGWSTDSSNEQGDPDDQFSSMMEMMVKDVGESVEQFTAIHNTLFTSTITCSSCGHKTDPNVSEERTLALPLEERLHGKGLPAFISAFLKDKIDGYKCEGCKKHVKIVRHRKISSPADVFTTQLKYVNAYGNITKTKVLIPATLDLSEHSADPTQRLVYKLVAAVAHWGAAGFGHYIAFGLGPDKKWIKFDDEEPSRVILKEVLKPAKFRPVLLYYQRVIEPETAVSQHSPGMPPARNQAAQKSD